MSRLARQARQRGMTVPMLGGDGWDSDKLLELSAGALEGSYFSNHYAADNPDPGQRRFVTAYQEAYGTEPDALAALGHDAALLAVDAMRRAPELSGPALREALEETTVLPGVTGPLSFDEKRNAVKPAVIMRVLGEGFRYVTTVRP